MSRNRPRTRRTPRSYHCGATRRWHTERVRACLLLVLAGCGGPGLFTDFSSVSVGTFTNGILRHGSRLPLKGEGYVITPLWAARNSNFATDEFVASLERVARRVHREYPGSLLQI